MLKLYNIYSIFLSADVTKKLTQQYVSLFLIIEKMGWLAQKFEVLNNQKIYLIFLIAQLILGLSLFSNVFHWPSFHYSLFVFINANTNMLKSFEIDCLLNKQMVKKVKAVLQNTLFAGPSTALNKIDCITSRTLTMQPNLLITMKKALLNKSIEFLIEKEIVMVLLFYPYFFILFHLLSVTLLLYKIQIGLTWSSEHI